MNERRMIDDGASALERDVLAAWEDEKAPRATRARAVRLAVEVAGLAAVAAGTTHAAAGLGAKGLGWGASWMAKGLAVALFVGASATVVATTAGVGPLAEVGTPALPTPLVVGKVATVPKPTPTLAASATASEPPTTTMELPASTPDSIAVAREATPRVVMPRVAHERGPSAVATATASSAPTVARAPRFTEEVSMLDDARGALAAHDPARALLVLDTFVTLYPTSVLGSEAEVLRIDALVARGDRDRAKQLATAFLEARPKSPYRQHVQAVLAPNASAPTRRE